MTGLLTMHIASGALYERQTELGAVHALLERAAAGRGGTLTIEGPAGVGRSRLLAEAVGAAEVHGAEVRVAVAHELEREQRWGAVLQLFEPWLTGAGTDDLDVRGHARLAGVIDTGSSGHVREDASERSVMRRLCRMTIELADQRPLVLLLDDAHLADVASLRFLAYLTRRLTELPIAVLVAIRTDEPSVDETVLDAIRDHAVALTPHCLTADAVRHMLLERGVLCDAGSDVEREVWEATQGNPFLLHEVATALAVDVEDGREIHPDAVSRFVSPRISRRVAARLRRLGAHPRQLAEAAATFAAGAPLLQVARLAQLELDDAVEAAARLVDARILASVDPASFLTPAIRSAISDRTPPGTASQHRALAARLVHADGAPPEQVAALLLDAAPVATPWARAALRSAARGAMQQGVPRQAARFLRRAVELTDGRNRDPALLIDLGIAEASSGATTSLLHFEQALASIADASEEARALYALGYTLYRYGRHTDAATVFRRGRERFVNRDQDLSHSFAAASIVATWFGVGGTPASVRAAAASQFITAPTADTETRSPTTSHERLLLAVTAGVWLTHGGGRARPAAQLARAAVRGAVLGSDDVISLACNAALVALISAGEPAEAMRIAEVLVDRATGSGDVLAFAEASAFRAFAAYSRGEVTVAMHDAKAAVQGVRQGWGTLVPIPQAILAQCHIERGELDLAETVLDRVCELAPTEHKGTMWGFFHWSRGRLRYERGDHAAAVEEFATCARLFGADGMRVSSAACPWRRCAALAFAALGDRGAALSMIDEDIALSTEVGLGGHLGAALQTRALIDGDPYVLFVEAIEHLETAEMPLELARALTAYGAWLRRSGRRAEARGSLRRACHIANEIGAVVICQHAREELLATGARIRRPATSGVDALTPAERRVAVLVARGMSNRQTAEALFVTVNTVEWHVRHVYAKLGVARRDEFRARYAAADITLGGA